MTPDEADFIVQTLRLNNPQVVSDTFRAKGRGRGSLWCVEIGAPGEPPAQTIRTTLEFLTMHADGKQLAIRKALAEIGEVLGILTDVVREANATTRAMTDLQQQTIDAATAKLVGLGGQKLL